MFHFLRPLSVAFMFCSETASELIFFSHGSLIVIGATLYVLQNEWKIIYFLSSGLIFIIITYV